MNLRYYRDYLRNCKDREELFIEKGAVCAEAIAHGSCDALSDDFCCDGCPIDDCYRECMDKLSQKKSCLEVLP